MTIAAFIPRIWSARFTDKLRQRLVWASLCNTNYMGEISAAGNTVVIPTGTTNITVKDYAVGNNIAAPEVNAGTTTDLVIDKQKYFHFLVDDVDAVQHRPALMDEAMDEAAYKMSLQIDNDVQAEFNKAYASGRSVRVTDDLSNAAGVSKLIGAFIDIKRRMTIANLPSEMRWAVVHPDFVSRIEQYFIATPASDIYVPAASESTLRNGFAGNLLGFNLYTTNLVPDVRVSSQNYWRTYCGQGMSAVTHAMQVIESEAYRPELRFGDAVKGLNVYGTKLVHNDRLFTIEHRKTT